MDSRQRLKNELDSVLSEYQTLADADPYKLRELIPSKELWRFFITKQNQIEGRNLKLLFWHVNNSGVTNHFSEYLNKPILDFIRDVEKITSLNLEAIANSSPLYRGLKQMNWLLNLQQLQRLTFNNLLILDRGWIPYEINEPGYLESLYFAFDRVFDFAALDFDHLQELHTLTTSNVKIVRYDNQSNTTQQKGAFRTAGLNALLTSNNSSIRGLRSLLDNDIDQRFTLFIELDKCHLYLTQDNLYRINTINPDDLTNPELLADIFNADQHTFMNYDLFKKAITLLFKLKKADDLASFLYSNFSSNEYILRMRIAYENIPESLMNLIHRYKATMQTSTTPDEKIMAIASFSLGCAQLTPFYAANGRTITMILLNQLLMENGLPPTILDDQNRFMGYSVEEIALEIVHGMQNTLTLVKEKQLFNVNTDEILHSLEKENLTDFSNYFNGITKLEDNFRLARKDLLQQIETLRSSDNPNLDNTSRFFQASNSKRKASAVDLTQKEDSSKELKKKRG